MKPARTIRGNGLAEVIALADRAGTHDAADLASKRRHRPVRATRTAPIDVDLHDDEECDAPALDAIVTRAEGARTRAERWRAVAELALYAASQAAATADAAELDAQHVDAGDVVEALTVAAAVARKAGA